MFSVPSAKNGGTWGLRPLKMYSMGILRAGEEEQAAGRLRGQWMVRTCPSVEELGVRSQARITGTNLSVRIRVSDKVPSSRSRYSTAEDFCLNVSPLTARVRPVGDCTTPEIAPAARASARCHWDKARAGARDRKSTRLH